jgi:hypothetical protein
MSDRPEGPVAREMYIRDNPITAVLLEVGIGYVLGKIV